MSSRRVHPLLLLLLLLCILAIATLSCSADSPPVYDTDGHELRADANYYVLPANRAHGGGLTMAPGQGRLCPLFVAQEPSGHGDGFPVRITPHDGAADTAPSSDQIIRLSTDVRIYFRAYTTCVQSTEWHIDSELLFGRRHVITGPIRGSSPTGRENAFRIKKYSGAAEEREYKLMSCGGDGGSCEDLGVFRDGKGGSWFLGATEPYHVVVFKKAPSAV